MYYELDAEHIGNYEVIAERFSGDPYEKPCCYVLVTEGNDLVTEIKTDTKHVEDVFRRTVRLCRLPWSRRALRAA